MTSDTKKRGNIRMKIDALLIKVTEITKNDK